MTTRSGKVYQPHTLDRVQPVLILERETIPSMTRKHTYNESALYKCQIIFEHRPFIIELRFLFATRIVETPSSNLEFEPTELTMVNVLYLDPARQDTPIKHYGMYLNYIPSPTVNFLHSHVQKVIGTADWERFSQELGSTVFHTLIEKACSDVLAYNDRQHRN